MVDYNEKIKKIFREVEPSEYRDDMFFEIVKEWEKEHGEIDGMKLYSFIKNNMRVPESIEELENWESDF